MSPLFHYTEQLLVAHDCVVIPSLGAVIKEPVAPRCDEKLGLLYPSEERFHFNSALSERDGLLDQRYSEVYAVSRRRAQILVDKEVEDAKQQLLEQKELVMGNIGRIVLQSNGSVEFFPKENASLFGVGRGASYGLLPVPYDRSTQKAEVLSLATLQKQKKSSVLLRMGRASAGVAAALFLMVFALVPLLSPSSASRYSAGFVAPGVEKPTQETVVHEKNTAEPSAKEESIAAPVAVEQAPRYYVVIASFATEATCQKYIATQQGRFFAETIGMLPKGKHIFVYSNGFATLEEANAARFEVVRAYPKEHASAWVFDASTLAE